MMDTVYIVKAKLDFGPDDTMVHDYDGVLYANKRLALEVANNALEDPAVLDAWVEELEVKR